MLDDSWFDVVIVGGGVAGLWTLHTLSRAGYRVLLIERDGLGAGQTGWSQGILHSGVKYALSGTMNESAAAVNALPERWRRCWGDDGEIDLQSVPLRSRRCWLWRTESLRSRMGMLGAKLALRTTPQAVADSERPAVLARCPGEVAALAEWVIEPRELVRRLGDMHAAAIVPGEVAAAARADGDAWSLAVDVRGASAGGDAAPQRATLTAGAVVLSAGNGNAALRTLFGLSADAQQVRPLRMLAIRGSLPELNGHCVDGAATRVTITSAEERDGQRVWQVGGQVAERGPSMRPDEHLRWALTEVLACVPGLSLEGCVAGAYDAPRAEGAAGGKRPDDIVVRREGSVVTVWPTKLVLAPRAADAVAEAVRTIAATRSNHGISAHESVPQPTPSACDRGGRRNDTERDAGAPIAPYVWQRASFAWQPVEDILKG